jgi:hypothetical protein
MRLPSRPKVTFKNLEIAYKSELSFLGLCITENLKWDPHIRTLSSKLCKLIYIVKSLKEVISPYMIKSIYYSNFQSSLRYSIIFGVGAVRVNQALNCKKKSLEYLVVSINICCVNKYLKTIIYSQYLCYMSTYWKWYASLKSTKTLWSKTYTFIIIIYEENWIYMFSIAIQFSSGKV